MWPLFVVEKKLMAPQKSENLGAFLWAADNFDGN
jgi:hypothetical protein